jgi:hypothetical protein
MPLKKGKANVVVSQNIAMLMKEGRPQAQAVAIAMRNAGRARRTKKKENQ